MDTQQIERQLVSARRKLTGVNGLLLAGTDGRAVAQSLQADAVNSTAAVSASSLQLARRLADLLGDGSLEEITVRSADGYVIVTPVGDRWVLTALTVRSANVARINLVFRDLCPSLAALLAPPEVTPNTVRTSHQALGSPPNGETTTSLHQQTRPQQLRAPFTNTTPQIHPQGAPIQ